MERLPFEELRLKLESLVPSLGGTLRVAGEVDGYPVLWAEIPGAGEGCPRVFLDAGIHGEEPGSVMGIFRWLSQRARRWRAHFGFTILPCLSPWGYERGIREDRQGRDPNRIFRREDEPLVRAVRTALSAGPRPVFAVDMHEDSDFDGFYMYALGSEDVAREVVDRVARVGPVAHGRDLDPPVERGVVTRDGDAPARDLEAYMEGRPDWPIAFLLHRAADRTVTLETPGRAELGLRAEMQMVAVETILSWLLRTTPSRAKGP